MVIIMNIRRFVHTLEISYVIIALLGLIYLSLQSTVASGVSVTEVALAKDSPSTVVAAPKEEESAEPESVAETVTEEVTEEEVTEEPSTEAVEEPRYTFVASHSIGRLFIRNGPSLDNQIIGWMKPGSTGNVLELGEEWSLIQYQETQGYTFNGYLEFIPIEE